MSEQEHPIRVAVVLGHWQNYGVETLVMNLYRNIDRSKVQFDFIVCETPNSDIPEQEIKDLGGRLYIVPSYSHLHAYNKALYELFSKNQYQIVHCHMSTLCPIPLRVAKKAGVPIRIAHCHTMAGKGEYAKNMVKYSLRLFAHAYPTHYATSSLMAGKWLFGAQKDMYYLPVARNIEAFRFNAATREKMRKTLGVENNFVIGHLGRFVPQKNHTFIVETFSKVLQRDPTAHLLLAGDGPLVDSVVQKINTEGLSDAVSYLGRRSDAADLYQAMDAFVLPSLYEGVPGTGIEAQAAGLSFIFADTITEEAKILNTAQRLSLDNSDAWVTALLNSKELPRKDTIQELRDAGYDIKQAAADLADYYENLLASLPQNN